MPGRRKRGRARRRWVDLATEDRERLERGRETKSIMSSGEYFRAVATPNREKPKEKEKEEDWRSLK